MERSGGRNSDDRAAAREARERARSAQEQGVPIDEDERAPSAGGDWEKPDLGSMSRYGGGIDMDVYQRRRLIAIGGAVVVIVLLFVLLGGC